jgi:acid phosphatase class B
MIITVAAGAVAAAAAPSTKEGAIAVFLKTAYVISTSVTRIEAKLASKRDIQITGEPDALMLFIVKFAPSENAIIPKTKFDMKSESIIILTGMRFSNVGPMRIPTKRYVVTAGKWTLRNNLAPK